MKKTILAGFVIVVVAAAVFFWAQEPAAMPGNALVAHADSLLAAAPDAKSLDKEIKRLRRLVDKSKPRSSYIVIDTHSNTTFMRTADSVLYRAVCSTGSGGELTDSTSGKKWIFHTPRGVYSIKNKIVEPWWRKPDWAFVEENEPIPKNASERLDPHVMGDYALGFGDGYFIHGTLYERLLGLSVSHGCVRLGANDLKYFYDRVPIGTGVYVL